MGAASLSLQNIPKIARSFQGGSVNSRTLGAPADFSVRILCLVTGAELALSEFVDEPLPLAIAGSFAPDLGRDHHHDNFTSIIFHGQRVSKAERLPADRPGKLHYFLTALAKNGRARRGRRRASSCGASGLKYLGAASR